MYLTNLKKKKSFRNIENSKSSNRKSLKKLLLRSTSTP